MCHDVRMQWLSVCVCNHVGPSARICAAFVGAPFTSLASFTSCGALPQLALGGCVRLAHCMRGTRFALRRCRRQVCAEILAFSPLRLMLVAGLLPSACHWVHPPVVACVWLQCGTGMGDGEWALFAICFCMASEGGLHTRRCCPARWAAPHGLTKRAGLCCGSWDLRLRPRCLRYCCQAKAGPCLTSWITDC